MNEFINELNEIGSNLVDIQEDINIVQRKIEEQLQRMSELQSTMVGYKDMIEELKTQLQSKIEKK